MPESVALTPEPVRISATGSNVKQDLRLALDVSSYDELDLLLTVYENTSGADIVVPVLTGMTSDSESSWVTAGTFSGTGGAGPAANKLNIKNFLRFIRYQLTTGSTFTTSFCIDGMGRRYASNDLRPPARVAPAPSPRDQAPRPATTPGLPTLAAARNGENRHG